MTVHWHTLLPLLGFGAAAFCYFKVSKRSAVVVLALMAVVALGTFQFQSVEDDTAEVRRENDRITFDRVQTGEKPEYVQKRNYDEEMDEKYEDLQDESAELLNKHLQSGE